MQTVLQIKCMWCGVEMGEKDGKGQSGVTSSICPKCWAEKLPKYEYPKGEDLDGNDNRQ